MADWRLSRRRERCERCERRFAADQALYSTLFVAGDELRREDVCPACFGAERADLGEDLIFWRGRFRVGKRALAVDFEALEGLFLALEGREERALRELRYLLALLLTRKKRLRLLRTAHSGEGDAMVMRRPRRAEELLVYVFDLTPERVQELRGRLRAIFEGAALEELLAEPPGPPPAAAVTPAEAPAGGDPAAALAPGS
jgi:hypothetical protein